MRNTSRRGRLAVLAASGVAVAALAAGCGSSGYGGSSTPPSASPAAPTAPLTPGMPSPSSPASPASPAAPATTATLRTATDARLGAIVTDSAGFTLYRFDQDSATPPTATCNGGCAAIWPPVPADGAVTVSGIDAKLVGTVTRADGSKQLTLAGWPLYRFAPDKKPGDTKGQGVDGTWFAVTPAGDRAAATAGSPAPGSPAPGGSGY
ncbi:hypothetical protein [Kitasatospora sp. NPDC093806]|uniref:hypothetical protein n=1 Tax=Kitasatospora sp. NPDC093806 TaxID=3155075 RepID=UPI00341605EC